MKKTAFLEGCDNFVEYLADQKNLPQKTKLLGDFLKDVVCESVLADDAKPSNEDISQVVGILEMARSLTSGSGSDGHNLKSYIANLMKEIGAFAMKKDDFKAVMDVIEKLSGIENTDNEELFELGLEGFRKGHFKTAVVVVRRLQLLLRGAFDGQFNLDKNARRRFYFWFGLLANMNKKGESLGDFAAEQFSSLARPHLPARRADFEKMANEAEALFRKRADFETIDAIRKMRAHAFN